MKKRIIHVGLDVHSKSIAMATIERGDEKPTTIVLPYDPKALRRALKKIAARGEVRCCYEAGPCGYEVWRLLAEMGIHCEVVAPSLIPAKPGDRVKTDRRDAAKLVRLFRAGELTAVRVPTPSEEATRDLVRAREDVRQELIAARHRLSKLLIRHGRIFSAGKNWTARYWRWLRQQAFAEPAAQIAFEHYQLQVLHLEERRGFLDREIAAVAASEPYRAAVDRLCCLRGISVLSALALIAEVQDFRRFDHPRQLMSFLGLVPSERSSGGTVRRGSITKAGNSHARRLLTEASWSYRRPPSVGPRLKRALAGQPPRVVIQAKKAQLRLHKRYARLVGRGKRSQVAVTAVARELCGFIWALMTEEAA
jgi:transposase